MILFIFSFCCVAAFGCVVVPIRDCSLFVVLRLWLFHLLFLAHGCFLLVVPHSLLLHARCSSSLVTPPCLLLHVHCSPLLFLAHLCSRVFEVPLAPLAIDIPLLLIVAPCLCFFRWYFFPLFASASSLWNYYHIC